MAWMGGREKPKVDDIEGLNDRFKGIEDKIVTKEELKVVTDKLSTLDSIKETLDKLSLNKTSNDESNNGGSGNGNSNAGGNAGGASGGGNNQAPEKTSFLEDEDKAFNERAMPIVGTVLETKAELVYDRVSRKFDDWPKYEKQIKEILAKSPLMNRANEQYVENCYYTVFAKEKKEEDNRKKMNLENGGGGAGANHNTDNTVKLTPEEEKYAKQFKMTPEQYAAAKGKLQFGVK